MEPANQLFILQHPLIMEKTLPAGSKELKQLDIDVNRLTPVTRPAKAKNGNRLLKTLPSSDLATLLESASLVSVRRGQVLQRGGDQIINVYLPLDAIDLRISN